MAILDYRGSAKYPYVVNAQEHRNALAGKTNDFGRALMQMLKGWEAYAQAHQARYEVGIGDDGVMGVYWAETGLAIKRLLDGDVGGLDCGSIGQNITEAIEAQGFVTDGYTLTDDE